MAPLGHTVINIDKKDQVAVKGQMRSAKYNIRINDNIIGSPLQTAPCSKEQHKDALPCLCVPNNLDVLDSLPTTLSQESRRNLLPRFRLHVGWWQHFVVDVQDPSVDIQCDGERVRQYTE